jgi:predicted metallo-beta-lactamase superfamily hydrolase
MLNVKPLAFDSFGVRSMATFVETDDVAVLIDPGVSLAPIRYGLPPHPIEEHRMNERWADIKAHVARSDVLIVTHYHYDHYDPKSLKSTKARSFTLSIRRRRSIGVKRVVLLSS